MVMQYYTFEKVLKELQIEEYELKMLVADGEIRAFRDGDRMKFKKFDIDTLKKNKFTHPTILPPSGEPDNSLDDSEVLLVEEDTNETLLNIDDLDGNDVISTPTVDFSSSNFGDKFVSETITEKLNFEEDSGSYVLESSDDVLIDSSGELVVESSNNSFIDSDTGLETEPLDINSSELGELEELDLNENIDTGSDVKLEKNKFLAKLEKEIKDNSNKALDKLLNYIVKYQLDKNFYLLAIKNLNGIKSYPKNFIPTIIDISLENCVKNSGRYAAKILQKIDQKLLSEAVNEKLKKNLLLKIPYFKKEHKKYLVLLSRLHLKKDLVENNNVIINFLRANQKNNRKIVDFILSQNTNLILKIEKNLDFKWVDKNKVNIKKYLDFTIHRNKITGEFYAERTINNIHVEIHIGKDRLEPNVKKKIISYLTKNKDYLSKHISCPKLKEIIQTKK